MKYRLNPDFDNIAQSRDIYVKLFFVFSNDS